uniref:Uncharacterized protein n=1 Tax=Myoviridae sp. cty4e12 TaxID=2827718 RepID=A0A8S5SP74_9CAUD|nr:MAG TPA: hypothetical protein [Myoviridae sp. cty4e12]
MLVEDKDKWCWVDDYGNADIIAGREKQEEEE